MEAELVELERRRVAASFARDIGALETLLHDAFVFIHSNGRIDRREDYLDLLASGNLIYERMESEGSSLAASEGNTAAMLDRLVIDATYFGIALHIETIVLTNWCRTSSGWQALCIQSTPTPATGSSQS